jgi:hypothetical protein
MPKYKIGDWLSPMGGGEKLKLHVVGIMQDTCVAGTQVHYHVRTYLKERDYTDFSTKGKSIWVPTRVRDTSEYTRFNECEVVPFVEPTEVNDHKAI